MKNLLQKNKNLILSIFYNFFKLFVKKKSVFRIIMLHNVNKENFSKIKKNLIYLKKNYNFIDPKQFKKDFNLKNKKNLLITFDDGFKSNYYFAEKVLNKIGIKAVFFIITDFIKIDKNSKVKKNLFKNIDIDKKIYHRDKLDLMTLSDIKKLQKMGHVIGSHTKSHLMLSKIKSNKELKKEISRPLVFFKKNKINNYGFFAFPFGVFSSFNYRSYKVAKKNYKFIFSGIRGDNPKFKNIFYRENIEEIYNLDSILFFISGYADFLYSKYRKKLFLFK